MTAVAAHRTNPKPKPNKSHPDLQAFRREADGQAPRREDGLHVGAAGPGPLSDHPHRPGQERAEKVRHVVGGR